MTADGWLEYSSVIWGVDDAAATDIKHYILTMPDDKAFLVYDREQWVKSATPVLMPGPDVRRQPGGEWVNLDSDAKPTSRCVDGNDPP